MMGNFFLLGKLFINFKLIVNNKNLFVDTQKNGG
jgi:hypothetical protein